MRFVRALAFALMALLMVEAALCQSDVNVVLNPGFEDWLDHWEGNAYISDDAHTGSLSAQISYSQLLKQTFSPAVSSGSVVLFAFWAKNVHGNKPLLVQVIFDVPGGERGSINEGILIDTELVPADGDWHYVDLTDWLKSVAYGRNIVEIAFVRASDSFSTWRIDDVQLLVGSSGGNDGQTTPPNWPKPQPAPGQGESPEASGGFLGWVQQLAESAREIIRRLLGNPTILLILIILIIVMAYYTTRRR